MDDVRAEADDLISDETEADDIETEEYKNDIKTICPETCEAVKIFDCDICSDEICLNHLNESIMDTLKKFDLDRVDVANIINLDNKICVNCLKVQLTAIEIQQQYVEEFTADYYGVDRNGNPAKDDDGDIIDGRMSKEIIESTSDWKWRIVCIEYMMHDLWDKCKFNVDEMQQYKNNKKWMRGQYEEIDLLQRFINYHQELVDKIYDTIWEPLINKDKFELIGCIIKFKTFIMDQLIENADILREYFSNYILKISDSDFMDRKEKKILIRIKKEYDAFCKDLWIKCKDWMRFKTSSTLRFLYDLELGTIYKESIIETSGSALGYLLRCNQTDEMLEKMLILYLALPKGYKLREKLARLAAKLYYKEKQRTGILTKKRWTKKGNEMKIRISKVIDKWMRLVDDGIFCLHSEDIEHLIDMNDLNI